MKSVFVGIETEDVKSCSICGRNFDDGEKKYGLQISLRRNNGAGVYEWVPISTGVSCQSCKDEIVNPLPSTEKFWDGRKKEKSIPVFN